MSEAEAVTTTFATVGAATPVLTIIKSNNGVFSEGEQSTNYAVTVTNAGTGPTSGTVTVTETIPSGLTLDSMQGTGWTCAGQAATLARAVTRWRRERAIRRLRLRWTCLTTQARRS